MPTCSACGMGMHGIAVGVDAYRCYGCGSLLVNGKLLTTLFWDDYPELHESFSNRYGTYLKTLPVLPASIANLYCK